MRDQTELLKSQVSGLDVRSDTSLRPNPKSRAVLVYLRRWWGYSQARIMLEELRNFPRRISAIRKTSHLRSGPELPLSPWGHSLETFPQVSSFLRACNEDIQRLRTENPWAGRLEVQMAAQAFQFGARWALCNSGSKTDSAECCKSNPFSDAKGPE